MIKKILGVGVLLVVVGAVTHFGKLKAAAERWEHQQDQKHDQEVLEHWDDHIDQALTKLEDKLGFGLSKSTTDFAGRLGVGIDVYLTSHVLLTAGASAVLTTTDISVAGQKIEPIFYVGGQAGVQYRF